VWYTNIRSLYANISLLKSLTIDIAPKIILLSESRTVENMNDAELEIVNYKIYRCDGANRHTGGAAIYVHNSISAHSVLTYDKNFIWCIAINVTRGFANDCFCVIYRGHQSTSNDFCEFFNYLCESLTSINSNLHIFGDINYDFKKDIVAKKLKTVARSFNLKQLVEKPTRVTNESSTIIDWYFTNRKNVTCEVLAENQISDHFSLSANFNCKSTSNDSFITVKSWKNYSIERLNYSLDQIDWSDYSARVSLNEKTSFLFDHLESIVDSLVTTQKIRASNKSFKWYNEDLKNMKIVRNTAHQEWRTNKSDTNWNNYKISRNKYKNALISAESEFISSQLSNNKSDPKKLWKILKSIYCDDKNNRINSIKFDGENITDDKIICDKLNSYFISSIENLAERIPKINRDPVREVYVKSVFTLKPINVSELKLFVKQIEKKSFVNNINGRVLNDAMCHEAFSYCFCDIINYSFMSGTFPDPFKTSIIVPIQKVKNSINHDELRPVNRLKIEESLIERVVKFQLIDYFEHNDLFIPEQSGFRKKHSCETALNFVVHNWRHALDNKNIVLCVFLDLKRAFETIDREVLIRKLARYGLDRYALSWFENFLSGRRQVTKFNECLSSAEMVKIGIPQGSVLSCILFIIFINDIKSVLKFSDISLFADDALIQLKCADLNDGLSKIKSDLDSIYNYLCFSRLSLNISKTKFMVVTNKTMKDDISLSINNESIERVSEYKYLGIILDDKMSFQPFIDDLCRKMNKKFAVFKRCEKKMNYNAKVTFYKSLVQSLTDSCGTILFLVNQSQLSRIQLIQNRFARTLLRADCRASITSMLDQLQWMSIKQRVNFNTLKFLQKVNYGQAPIYLQALLRRVGDTHGRTTRQRDKFAIIWSHRISVFQNGLQLYNHVKEKFIQDSPNCSLKTYFAHYVLNNF
jgi:hypothetical protein